MEPAELIERLRRIASVAHEEPIAHGDAVLLDALADVLEHRAVEPAYSETARHAIESVAGEVGSKVGRS